MEQSERQGYLAWLLKRTQSQLAGLSKSAKAEESERKKALEKAEAFLLDHLD